jgi:hypothetical protein
MVELQPSKLVMRVRFPSPAPSSITFFDFALYHVRDSGLFRAASLPVRCFSSSIAILELIYVNTRDWWDYLLFYPNIGSLKAGAATLNLPPIPTFTSQDTGMAMNLFGYRGSTWRPALTGPSSPEAAGTHHETGLIGERGPLCRARRAPRTDPPDGPGDPYRPSAAARTGQQDKDRGQVPPESTGTVQPATQNVRSRRFPTRRTIRSTLLPMSGR